MNRLICFLCLVAIAAALGSNAGCTRQHYRKKADREVYTVLREGNNDPRWKIDDYRIIPDPTSRMYDPYHPDREPMPLDDPAAHQKMHWVGGMRGSPHWYDNGVTHAIENPRWRQSLLLNDRGEIPMDRDKAIELARLHSPEYQTRRESLYAAAMRVATQRFRYDVQFRGFGDLAYSSSKDQLTHSATLAARRQTAAGAQWVVELANTVTWTFTGQSSWQMSNLIDVGLTQPLLRGASRKFELENLTQAERDFLYEVREMVLFQQGHYARIVTGTAPPNSGVSGGTGFYGLLVNHIQIQNQRQNIIGLEENLSRFLEMFEANQVTDVTQIEETRQNLLTAQSRLLGQINTYQGSVESYIRSLGLPPDERIRISDPLLEQFQLTSPELTVLMEDVADMLAMIRKRDVPLPDNFKERTRDVVRRAGGEMIVLGQDLDILQRSMPERISSLRDLEAALADRLANGERIDPSIYNTATFEDRIIKLRTTQIPQNLTRLRAVFTVLGLFVNTDDQDLRDMILNHSLESPMFDEEVLKALEDLNLSVRSGAQDLTLQQPELADPVHLLETGRETLQEKTPEEIERELRRVEARRIIAELRRKDEYRDWIRRVFSAFQYELVSLSLNQTRTRLDSMTLVPVSVTAEEAFRSASEHRLDLMNEQARLVDRWRQIEVEADQLKGALSVVLGGTAGRVDKQGVRFADNSELRATLRWDTPLNRYGEMMDYRSSHINYQRARRNYYGYIDTVHANLRDTVRNLEMRRIDFEINRNAVLIGTVRVDVMQLRMERPPTRGGSVDANAARDLISALNGLTTSQNELLNTWVQYQTQRMLLDYGMGTMKLDDRGRWIDPGGIDPGGMGSAAPSIPMLAPAVPLQIPIPIPMLDAPRLNRRYVEE